MTKFEVNYGELRGAQRIPKKEIAKIVKSADKILKVKDQCEISIAFVTEQEIKILKEAYYGGTGATDVLSFSSKEPYAKSGYLGEIVINYNRAKQQAVERGVNTKSETLLLLAHPILHLRGFDHDTPQKKARMFRYQDRILLNNGK